MNLSFPASKFDIILPRVVFKVQFLGGKYYNIGCHSLLKQIAQNEGALFSGLAAKLLRLCPAGGVIMMENEMVYDYLIQNYPLDK